MNRLEFGERKENFRYVVFVCPKCRKHAQITETGKKTLRCQHCGALLQARRLRALCVSEELSEAVDFRTRMQAELSGEGPENFFINLPPKNPSPKGPETLKSGAEEREDTSEKTSKGTFQLQGHFASSLPKKDHKSIILELLEAEGGKMEMEKLREKALEKGINPEKFDITLKKLLEAGEIYSPEAGKIKLI